MAEPISPITTELSYQIGITASFVRTHFVINDLILNGDLVEAVTLIRKQLESVARMNELDSKPLSKLAGKVPNIGNALKGAGKGIYGDLSEIAHFAKPRVAELLHITEDGEKVGPSLLPKYNEYCLACFDMHHFVCIYFLGWVVEKIANWYPSQPKDDARKLLYLIVATAQEAGVIKLTEPSLDQRGR